MNTILQSALDIILTLLVWAALIILAPILIVISIGIIVTETLWDKPSITEK